MRVPGAVATLLAVLGLVASLAGCGEIKVRAGSPVEPALLESRLSVGKSTAEDVRRILGDPVSVGRDFLPFHARPRTVWSYHFEESQASLAGVGESHRIFLWVFLADDRYDGYLWVSSFPDDRQVH